MKTLKYMTRFLSEANSFSFENDIWTSVPNEHMGIRDQPDGVVLYFVARESDEYEQLICKSPQILTSISVLKFQKNIQVYY